MIFFVLITLLLLLIFFIGTNNSINHFNNNNINLAIHTVFLPDENIYFLEEWIKYHLHIGFDKIYLYDNNGSKIGNGNLNDNEKKINRYGANYSKLFSNKEHIKNEYDKILKKYSKNVIKIVWQPKNENNEIHYGYVESLEHYKENYRNENDWTAFIDIDEFIILNSNKYNLKDFIKSKQKENINKIVIKQNKMEDRFCQIDKSIYEIKNSIDVNTDGWAPKNICKNSDLGKEQLDKSTAMHNITLNKEISFNASINELYFNHYNVNKKQIDWMKDYFKKDSFITKKDNNLNKYKDKLYDLNLLLNRNYDKNYFEILKKEYCYKFN